MVRSSVRSLTHQSLRIDKPNLGSSLGNGASSLNGDGLRNHHPDTHTRLTSTVEKKSVVSNLICIRRGLVKEWQCDLVQDYCVLISEE